MNEENEISLKELILVLLKQKKLIAFITLGVTVLAIVVSLLMPNVYEARSQVFLQFQNQKILDFGYMCFRLKM